jgi:hypothetical protein
LSLAMICGISLRRRLSTESAIIGDDLANRCSSATIWRICHHRRQSGESVFTGDNLANQC